MTPDATTSTILIVEDEILALKAMAEYLQSQGRIVVQARTPQEALAHAADADPDVLVCDWKLGGDMDGVEVARQIQIDLSVGVVMMTGSDVEQLQRDAADLDNVVILGKPITLEHLSQSIDSVLIAA